MFPLKGVPQWSLTPKNCTNAHQSMNIAWPVGQGKIIVKVVHDICFAAVLQLQEYPPSLFLVTKLHTLSGRALRAQDSGCDHPDCRSGPKIRDATIQTVVQL